jgi:MoxR-like ATPase
LGLNNSAAVEDPAAVPAGSRILERLGIIGMESVEPVMLAALIQQDPLLLVGAHGTGSGP